MLLDEGKYKSYLDGVDNFSYGDGDLCDELIGEDTTYTLEDEFDESIPGTRKALHRDHEVSHLYYCFGQNCVIFDFFPSAIQRNWLRSLGLEVDMDVFGSLM